MQHWTASNMLESFYIQFGSQIPHSWSSALPLTVCATLRINEGFTILSKMKSLEHKALQNSCSRIYQRVVLLSVIWETKARFKSSIRGSSLAVWKHRPHSPCPCSLCTNTVTSEYEKKGKKHKPKPTLCKTVKNKMFIAYYTMSSTSGLHNTWCSFEPN